jgi:N-acetylglutamate synthase-like GNAT family acetyltransferase
MNATIRRASADDLDAIKALCDAHRLELGFVMRPALIESIARGEVLVAFQPGGRIVGLVDFHHRRDQQTTLYHLAVNAIARGHGIGRELVEALRADAKANGKQIIRLKCPVTLAANGFYARVGFTLLTTEPGKTRALNIWELTIG